jgi:RNA-directed DNA polymerase
VVAMYLEPRAEPKFHPDSYGYRPGRSPLDAVGVCRERCWKKDWIIDCDVEKFFDTVPWDLIIKAVETITDARWVLLYVRRWLAAPLQRADGTLVARDKGTPQGSAVSPILANLFMNYAFDMWMRREFPSIQWERFADDLVVHCVSKRQAEHVLSAIAARMEEVGLRLHPKKTRIVYCKDGTRRGKHEHTSFTFLGYTFRQREAKSKTGKRFSSFLPAMSDEAQKTKGTELRRMSLHRRTNLTLDDLARWLNPIVRGWMNYYGRFYRSAMYPLLQRVSTYLMRWTWKKYRRLRTHKRFKPWWRGLLDRVPQLFAHWKWVRAY